MTFSVCAAKHFYYNYDKEEIEKLQELGFSFINGEHVDSEELGELVVDKSGRIEINEMSELRDFIRKYGKIVIELYQEEYYGEIGEITIYNDYLD